MVFKERTFRGEQPEDEKIKADGKATGAALEAQVADFLASVPALDATQISVVASGPGIVLSGFVPSTFESETAEATIREAFNGLSVENRLRVG